MGAGTGLYNLILEEKKKRRNEDKRNIVVTDVSNLFFS